MTKSVKNKEYTENHSNHFFNLIKNLGFDCRYDKGSTTIYSKNTKSYYTVSPENSYHKKFKSFIVRQHLESGEKNKKNTSVYVGKIENKFIFKSLPEIENLRKEYYFGNFNKDTYKLKKLEIIMPIMKHNNVAFREYDKTEIIAIDIDTHKFTESRIQNNSFNFLEFEELNKNIYDKLKELNLNIVLYEDSKICRGIHVYIKLKNLSYKEKIKENLKEYLEKQFTEISVEFRNQNKSLRIPFSYDYNCRNLSTFKVMNKTCNKVNQSLELIKNNSCIDNLEIYNKLKHFIKKQNVKEKTNIFYKNKTYSDQINISNFKITSGNRVGGEKVQWKLLGNCLLKNKSLNEFISLSKTCNIGSHDLMKWNENTLIKNLTQMYTYGQRNFVKRELLPKTSNTLFISSLNLITENDKLKVKDILIKYENKLIKKNKYNKQSKRLLNECNTVFLELIGKIKYENLNSRKLDTNIISEFNLTKQKQFDLIQGYQFPKIYLDRLKNHYKLKSNILTIFEIFKNLFLNLYEHKNGTTYIPILGSCKQYTLNDFYLDNFERENEKETNLNNTKYYDCFKNKLKNNVIHNTINREQIGEG